MALRAGFQAVPFPCILHKFLMINCIFLLPGGSVVCCRLGLLWWPLHPHAYFVSCAQQPRTEPDPGQPCAGWYQPTVGRG